MPAWQIRDIAASLLSRLARLGDDVFGGGIDDSPALGRLAAAELAIPKGRMTLMVEFSWYAHLCLPVNSSENVRYLFQLKICKPE